MAAAERQRALIIAGMHRSGTSLVASMLQRSGLDLGSDLVEPNEGNPHGYHEDKDFVDFHDDLLRRSEQRIFVQDESYLELLRDEDVERARRLVSQRSGDTVWGWKDPRTSLFLDLWRKLLPQARFVFVFRHPIDVVLSLMRRGFETELEVLVDPLAGLRSWEVHNRAILSFVERQPEHCVLGNVYSLLEDPTAIIRLAQKKLGLPLETGELDEIIHRKSLHATYSSPRVDSILQRSAPRVAKLYRRLESKADLPGLGHGPAGDDDEGELGGRLEVIASLLSSKVADRVTARPLLAAALAMIDPSAASLSGRSLRGHLSRNEGRVTSLRAHCDNLEALRAEDSSLFQELRRHADNLEAEGVRDQEQIRELSKRADNLEADHVRAQEQIRELSKHSDNLEARYVRAQKQIRELSKHADNLEADHVRAQEQIRELSKHADNLETDRGRDREQIRELSKHVDNLEADRGRDQERIRGLSKHADNLAAERGRDQERIEELSRHAENLEQLVQDRQEHIRDLESQHVDQRLSHSSRNPAR